MLEKHLLKPLLILGQVCPTDPAQELHITHNLRFIHLLLETAILILHITGSQNHTIGYFNKLSIITAFRAGNFLVLESYHTTPTVTLILYGSHKQKNLHFLWKNSRLLYGSCRQMSTDVFHRESLQYLISNPVSVMEGSSSEILTSVTRDIGGP